MYLQFSFSKQYIILKNLISYVQNIKFKFKSILDKHLYLPTLTIQV